MVEQLIFCYRDRTVYNAFILSLTPFSVVVPFRGFSDCWVLGFWFECFSFVVTQ